MIRLKQAATASGGCRACQRENAAASYQRHRQKRIEYSRQWRLANPEKAAAHARKQHRKTAGIANPTGEIRGGFCEICGREFSTLVLDHDHDTGQVRGWLCHRCNAVLPEVENKGWLEKSEAVPNKGKNMTTSITQVVQTTDRDAAAILGASDSLDGRQLVAQARGDLLPYEDAYECGVELIEIRAEKNYDSRGVRVLLRVEESSRPDLVKPGRQYTLWFFDQNKALPDFVLAEMVVSRIQFAATLAGYEGDPLEEDAQGNPKFKAAPVLLQFHKEVEPLGLKMRFKNTYLRTTRNGKKLHKLSFEMV